MFAVAEKTAMLRGAGRRTVELKRRYGWRWTGPAALWGIGGAIAGRCGMCGSLDDAVTTSRGALPER